MVESAPTSYENQTCLIMSMDILQDGFSANINHPSQHTVGDIWSNTCDFFGGGGGVNVW